MGNKGITLVALVITIIVLLILAAISLSILTGENGIITKAEEATQKTQEAGEEENKQLEEIENILNDYNTTGGNTSGGNTSGGGTVPEPDVANVEITKNPDNIEMIERTGNIEFAIEAEGEGTKSYQWYENSINSNVEGTPITGATNGKYTIPANEVTTDLNEKYYYCVVTLKKRNSNSNGN